MIKYVAIPKLCQPFRHTIGVDIYRSIEGSFLFISLSIECFDSKDFVFKINFCIIRSGNIETSQSDDFSGSSFGQVLQYSFLNFNFDYFWRILK